MKSVQTFFQLMLATAREIFDENAYQRFLLRTSSVPSVESYSRFVRERDAAMAELARRVDELGERVAALERDRTPRRKLAAGARRRNPRARS